MSLFGKVFAEVIESILDVGNISKGIVADIAKIPVRLFERVEIIPTEEFSADTQKAIKEIKSK